MNILVVNTQSMNHENATGITMRSIFKIFPSDDIFELYMQPKVAAADVLNVRSKKLSFDVCFVRTLANRLKRTSAIDTISDRKQGHENKDSHSILKRIAGKLLAYIDCCPIILARGLKKEIDEFSPDCIYTMGNAVDTMKLAVKISKYKNIPIVPHFMDNWQESHRFGSDKHKLHIKATQKWLRKLYMRAPCALAISEKMANEYDRRWGIKHYALMNTADVEKYHCSPKKKEEKLVFVYAGGLHLGRDKSLLEFAKALSEFSGAAVLNIYTDLKSRLEFSKEFECFDFVKVLPAVSHDDVKAEIYEKSDILVHIETFDESYEEFIRYSMSTKISEYLSTGRPILLYAPQNICVCQYLRENSAAFVASSPDELKRSISEIMNDINTNEISENAYKLAREKHDEKSVLEQFKDIMISVTERGGCNTL